MDSLKKALVSLLLELTTSCVTNKSLMELIGLLTDGISHHTHEVICFNLDNIPCQLQNLDDTKYEGCVRSRSSLELHRKIEITMVLVYDDQYSQSV